MSTPRKPGPAVTVRDEVLFPTVRELKLDSGLRRRGEEMYFPDEGSRPANRTENAELTKNNVDLAALTGLLGSLPVVGPGLAIGAQTLLAPRVLPGARAKKINELANSDAVMGSYDYDTNTYGNINIIDRIRYGIKPDDVTNKYFSNRKRKLENSDAYQSLEGRLTDEEMSEVTSKGALTSTNSVLNRALEIKKADEIESLINQSPNGPELLAAARAENGGKRLTNSQLQQVRAQAAKKDAEPAEQRLDRELDIAEGVNTNEANRLGEVARSNRANEGLKETELYNNNQLAVGELNYLNDKLGYDTEVANAKLKYEYDSQNFDRELKRDLALLGIEDNREERRYRSERDRAQDRQLFILQLMKGLGGLGAAFGG